MTDERARALFDAQPHRHPSGRTPDWNLQPEHIRDVFRRKASTTNPNPERQSMDVIPTDVYSAIGDACEAYDAQFGYPADTAGAEVRYQWSRTFPAVVAINAAYDALKAESLAINPHVECHLVDPDKASHWYEWVKDTRGYRPTGFMTLAMVEADMKMLETERPYDEMDEAA